VVGQEGEEQASGQGRPVGEAQPPQREQRRQGRQREREQIVQVVAQSGVGDGQADQPNDGEVQAIDEGEVAQVHPTGGAEAARGEEPALLKGSLDQAEVEQAVTVVDQRGAQVLPPEAQNARQGEQAQRRRQGVAGQGAGRAR
jgi:hypothetical protein